MAGSEFQEQSIMNLVPVMVFGALALMVGTHILLMVLYVRARRELASRAVLS
jgi:hypothetical protein